MNANDRTRRAIYRRERYKNLLSYMLVTSIVAVAAILMFGLGALVWNFIAPASWRWMLQ